MDFIESQKIAQPDLARVYDEFADLHQRKLWHQLSEAITKFLSEPRDDAGDTFLALYDGFIRGFESKLNQVTVARISSLIGGSLSNPEAAMSFFEKVLENKGRLGAEATMCIEMEIVLVKVRMGKYEDAKNALDENREKLNGEFHSMERIVFSKFFKAESEYRKAVGPPHEFYKAALMYLVYTPADGLEAQESFCLATDIAVAAMTAEGVYNFGEVIASPILDRLINTPNSWMRDLILAMHKGSIEHFNSIVDSNKEQYFAQPALSNRNEEVKQKLVMLALMNMAFELHPHDRTISFAKIADTCLIPVAQVEWMIMRAMSLHLIEGTIDEVSQVVDISWVQPRVLDEEQLMHLRDQVLDWRTKVKEMLLSIEDQTPELFS